MTELLTVPEVAALLRTSTAAVYLLISRGTLPGVTRLGRRVLVQSAVLRKHLGLTAVRPDASSTWLASATGSERRP